MSMASVMQNERAQLVLHVWGLQGQLGLSLDLMSSVIG